MSKEIKNIIAAFKEAQQQGRHTALATIVHVEGSSYRRPGARMLVEDNGRMTGAISGGCLEGDALRKALLAIHQKQNTLVTYNTLDEDDVEFGVQLGCHGIVHILFEPVDPLKSVHPIALLEACFLQRKDAVLVTMFSLKNRQGHQPGTCFFSDGEKIYNAITENKLAETIKRDVTVSLPERLSVLKEYKDHELAAFLELVEPPVSLMIIGAGNDALPMVEIATTLGWQVTIIDGRPAHATRQRFPGANDIIVGKPGEARNKISIDKRTVIILMTHNYHYDLEMLALLLQEDCPYIGMLGPRKRSDRMLAELKDRGLVISEARKNILYGPTGLDIGAETSEEIALSVLAEIKAVLTTRKGSFLRDRQEGIHSRAIHVTEESKSIVQAGGL
jgi:xanthine dehydrogenase accessory factor